MKSFEPIDEETGIEQYPGYLGMTWDGEVFMIQPLIRFQEFDWRKYWHLLEEAGRSGEITFEFQGKSRWIEYEPYADVAYILDELTSVEVHRDDGVSYGGMASGSGYIFFLKDGYSLDEVVQEFYSLMPAIDHDLACLLRES